MEPVGPDRGDGLIEGRGEPVGRLDVDHLWGLGQAAELGQRGPGDGDLTRGRDDLRSALGHGLR
jgi:hypothetical protein